MQGARPRRPVTVLRRPQFVERLEPRRLLSSANLDPTSESPAIRPAGSAEAIGVSATAVALAPDGKLVLGGAEGRLAGLVMRFNADGSPDQSFGGDGVVHLPQTLFGGKVTAVAVRLDGSVLVAAPETLISLNADGSLDTSFGGGDGVAHVYLADFEGARQLLVQPDGKILAAGGVFQVNIARVLPDGQLDPSFGERGLFTVDTTFGRHSVEEFVHDLALDPNGKIVVAASTPGREDGPFSVAPHGILVRVNANGTLDSSFGGDGVVDTNPPGVHSAAYAVRPLSDGRLAVAGTVNTGFFFARYHFNGAPDATYGTAGYVVNPNASPDFSVSLPSIAFRRMQFAPDGKVLAAGAWPGWLSPTAYVAVRRFTADGALDASFGSGGEVRTSVGREPRAADLAVGTGGEAAVAVSGPTTGPPQFTAIRYTPRGQPDPAFGGDGIVTVAFPRVSEVYVRGSTWSAAFKTLLETRSLGDADLGYRTDDKPATDLLPWTNVDEVVVRFTAAPSGSGVPAVGMMLDGTRSDYQVIRVTALDPQTFALRLDRPLGDLPAGGQDGDRVTLSVPGGGPADTPYTATLTVLQGDVNKSGSVLANDYSEVKSRFFQDTTNAGYGPFHDIDGSGSVLANDYSAVKSRFFDRLPAASPVRRQGGEWVSASLFPTRRILS